MSSRTSVIPFKPESVAEWVELRTTGAKFKKGMPPEIFVASLQWLNKVEGAIQLAIGDAINFGEKEYGEEVWQYVSDAGVGETAVRNWAWVAGAVPERNRLEGMDFTDYRAVAKIEDKTEQAEILQEAKSNEWTSRELEQAVKMAERVKGVKRRKKADMSGEAYTLIKGVIPDAAGDIEDSSIDLLITDPANPREFLDLYEQVAALADRVLKPQGVLLIYAAQDFAHDAIRLASPFITYLWMIAAPLPKAIKIGSRHISSQWRPVLLFVKGEVIPNWVADIVELQEPEPPAEGAEEGAITEPLTINRQLIELFTLNGESVLDPFMAEGDIVVEAFKTGRRVTGIDSDKNAVETVRARLAEAMEAPSPPVAKKPAKGKRAAKKPKAVKKPKAKREPKPKKEKPAKKEKATKTEKPARQRLGKPSELKAAGKKSLAEV